MKWFTHLCLLLLRMSAAMLYSPYVPSWSGQGQLYFFIIVSIITVVIIILRGEFGAVTFIA